MTRDLAYLRPLFFSLFLPVALVGLALSTAGCYGPVEVDADIGSTANVSVEEFVERPWQPQVFLHPQEKSPPRPLNALFFPFRLRQSMGNAGFYGREIARMFWQTWLREKVFPAVEFMENSAWKGGAAAVAEARARGADLAVGGEITQFMSGGTVGDSNLAIRLEIYDAVSGALIWSVAHAGQMRNRTTQDYILFTKTSKLPADPLYAITSALAWDLSKPVKEWNYGQTNCPDGNCAEKKGLF